MTSKGPGDPAPDFAFTDAEGHHHTLGGLQGTPVILMLLPASSRGTQPVLQRVTFRGESIPVLAPLDEAASRSYGVNGAAAVFVVSRGRIVWSKAGRHVVSEGAAAPSALTRREFIAALLAASISATVTSTASAAHASPAAPAPHDTVDVELTVNGKSARLRLDPRTTLLDALRESLRLTGTKKGCDLGQCGACTVHMDGRRVLSCLTLAMSAHGRSITTIEGLSDGDRLHPLQEAFIKEDGFQCGYCTAGQIMSGVALLEEPCGPSDDDVRECMSGNICRCGAYPGIVAAIQSVRKTRS